MPEVLVAMVMLGSALAPSSAVAGTPARCATSYEFEIDAAVSDVASVWGVPSSLVKAIIQRESAFQPQALSRAGAVGLMQVLPRNAERLGVARGQLGEPGPNILAGTRLLAVLLRHYRGDVVSALVAYNARPRRVFAPLPENGETALYVRAVLEGWRRFAHCGHLEGRAAKPSDYGRGRDEITSGRSAVLAQPLPGRAATRAKSAPMSKGFGSSPITRGDSGCVPL